MLWISKALDKLRKCPISLSSSHLSSDDLSAPQTPSTNVGVCCMLEFQALNFLMVLITINWLTNWVEVKQGKLCKIMKENMSLFAF